jgi:hypothetical protein
MLIKIVYSTHYGYSINPLLVKAIHSLSTGRAEWNYGESITSFVFRSNNRETVRNGVGGQEEVPSPIELIIGRCR